MVQIRSKVRVRVGTIEPLGDPGLDSFIDVGFVRGVNGPSAEAPELDSTHLLSIRKEFLLDIPDNGSLELEGGLSIGDTAQEQLRDDVGAGKTRNYRLEVLEPTDQTNTTVLATFDSQGLCNNFSHSFAGGAIAGFTAGVKLTGQEAWT